MFMFFSLCQILVSSNAVRVPLVNSIVSRGYADFSRSKPHCNIGTIGHVDHGKTTLTAAITKGM